MSGNEKNTNSENCMVVEFPVKQSMGINEILDIAKTIDTKKIADEVLTWCVNNVENYIDNKVKMFKLDLIIDDKTNMPETKKIQDLYRSIPDDADVVERKIMEEVIAGKRDMNLENKNIDETIKCRKELDLIVEKSKNIMSENKELLEKLFKRMSFFYELKGIKDGNLILQELEGSSSIIQFNYDAFTVGVKIKDEDKNVVKEYDIPEGFSVWIEIAFRSKARPTSLF